MAFRTTSLATSPIGRQFQSSGGAPSCEPPVRSLGEVRANRKDIRLNEFVEAVRLSFSNVPDRTSFGHCPDATLRLRDATTLRLLKDGADIGSELGSLASSIALERRNAYDTEMAPYA